MKLCLLIQLNLKLFLAPNISLYPFRSNALQVVRFVTVYSKHLYNTETGKKGFSESIVLLRKLIIVDLNLRGF